MAIFWAMLGVLMLICSRTKKTTHLFMSILILLLGLRSIDMTNNDTSAYYEWFTYDVDLIHEQFEWLYSYLCQFAKGYYLPYEVVQMSMACITFIFLYLSFKKEGLNIILAFAMYYLLCDYFRSFNFMRQMTAGPIVLYALTCLRYNEIKKFIFFIIIASGIHATSLAILPLYFFRKENTEFHKKIIVIILLITFIGGAINAFYSIITSLSSYMSRYVTTALLREETFSLAKLLMNIIYVYMYDKMDKKSIYTKAYFIGICLMNIITFSPDMMRISYHFLIAQVIVFGQIWRSNVKIKNTDKFIIASYCVVTFVYLVLYSNMSGVLDYKITDRFHY